VIPYKDYKDVYILGGTDDIIQLLDDANINIATIASSRHVGPIKPRVEEWQANLDLFSKTLDAWSKCQKIWQYLESIFGAPDIQRQLPAEAKMFNQVDKTFKDVMRKTNKIPLAIKAGTQPGQSTSFNSITRNMIDVNLSGYLELFQTNNALLEQIQHALASYLETKRSNFAR
jgi:dynein heavy chain, axonemal